MAARKWAAEVAEAINAKERDLRSAAATMTKAGLRRIAGYAEQDHGLYYPGPLPFTPIGVTERGARASIKTCWLGVGYAENRTTGKPAEKRDVDPVVIELRREDETWKVTDTRFVGSWKCRGVDIPTPSWDETT